MLGIGGTELVIICFFVLLIFGPDKLPQLGRTIGRFMKEFKRAQEAMEATIKAEMGDEKKIDIPEPPAPKPAPPLSRDLLLDDEEEEEEE